MLLKNGQTYFKILRCSHRKNLIGFPLDLICFVQIDKKLCILYFLILVFLLLKIKTKSTYHKNLLDLVLHIL